jgi:hypothetical protein
MDVFKKYANPNTLLAPLIPVEAGSLFPSTVKQLQAAMTQYETKRRAAERQGVSLDCFDPFVVCESFVYGSGAKGSALGGSVGGGSVGRSVGSIGTVEDSSPTSSTTSREVIRALPEEPKLDVPLSQAITTADLLSRLGLGAGTVRPAAPFGKVPIDFNDFEKRTSDYPGDWRYLYDLDAEFGNE